MRRNPFGYRVNRRHLLAGSAGLAGMAALSRGRFAHAQDNVELDVYVHANHPFDRVKPLFEEANPNVTLNMMEQSDVPTFRATLAAEGEGTPDLLWPEIDLVQELGKTGVLLDVSDLVEKHINELSPGKVAECHIASTGQYAAFPGDIAAVGLYYRADLFEEAGVTIPDDWTWAEYIEAAQTVKEATGAYSAFFPPDDGSGQSTIIWQYLLCQLGGSITNADGTEITMDDERGVAALELLKQMYEAEIGIEDNPTTETFFAALSGGQIAAMPMPVWYRGFGVDPNVYDEQSGLGQWRVALLPRVDEGSVRTANWGGAAIASTIYTEHPDEVRAFMEFALASMEGATACGDWGILPPYLPYLQSEAWTSARSEAFGDFAYNEVWTQAVDQYPSTWYKQAVFGEATQTLAADLMPILRGEVEVAAGLKTVGDRVRELNQRYQS